MLRAADSAVSNRLDGIGVRRWGQFVSGQRGMGGIDGCGNGESRERDGVTIGEPISASALEI